jgi:membrane protein DedA with SNARE-associated domain
MSTRWRAVFVIILALAVPVLPFVTIGELPGERWLSASDDRALVFGAVGALLLAADVLLPIPSSVVGTLLGARLGAAYGFAAAFTGLTLGHFVGYAVGRMTLRRLDARLPTRPALLLVFLSRPVPVLAEALAITAGAARMPFAPFAGCVAAGNAVYAAALAANGATLIPAGLAGPGLVLPMLLPAVGWLVWRLRMPQSKAEPAA